MESSSSVVFASLVVLGLAAGAAFAAPAAAAEGHKPASSFFELKYQLLGGKAVDLADYRGRVVLVVNVASQCGFTRQYAGLQALHDELSPKGLVVLGFPSNEFGGQEPGTAEEIATFCKKNFGVTFPILTKGVVKPGPEQSNVYTFLIAGGDVPSWNFCKYLVGKDGQVQGFFPSKVEPDDKALRERILAEVTR